MTAPRVVFGAALLVIVSLFVFALLHKQKYLIEDNALIANPTTVRLDKGATFCQPDSSVPAKVGRLELLTKFQGTSPGIESNIKLDGGHELVGKLARGEAQNGLLQIPLSSKSSLTERQTGRMCVRNSGPNPIELTGDAIPALEGRPGTTRLFTRWWSNSDQTSWHVIGSAMKRATFGRADLGTWTPMILLASVWLFSCALVLWVIKR